VPSALSTLLTVGSSTCHVEDLVAATRNIALSSGRAPALSRAFRSLTSRRPATRASRRSARQAGRTRRRGTAA